MSFVFYKLIWMEMIYYSGNVLAMFPETTLRINNFKGGSENRNAL
jgi:hypothetical protein